MTTWFFLSTENETAEVHSRRAMPKPKDITKSLQKLLKRDNIQKMIESNEKLGMKSCFEIKIYALASHKGGKHPFRINEEIVRACFANLQDYQYFLSKENYLNVCINNKFYELKEVAEKIQEIIETFVFEIEDDYYHYCV